MVISPSCDPNLVKKHLCFLLAHEFSKYCLWWGKKLTSSDLFHLGATVLTTHITLCLSGVQCQYFEWSTMSTLVSWSSTQRPVNNRSQPMCHLPPSTLLPPSPLLQKSSQKHSSFEWLNCLLHFSILSNLLECPHPNTWTTPSYQPRVLGEKWHFKLRVRRWQSRCESYEWYQHHILCSIQTFFSVCWDIIIANYQKLQKMILHLEGVLLLNITHISSPHLGVDKKNIKFSGWQSQKLSLNRVELANRIESI